jgi:hypothetical protein
MGRLKTAGAQPGHRIFVDHRVVGETPGSVLVPCGEHSIKIGSGGRALTVEVPCRGEIGLGE